VENGKDITMSAPTEQDRERFIKAFADDWALTIETRDSLNELIDVLLQAERERTRAEDIEVAKAFGDHYIARSIVAGLLAAALEAAQLPQGKDK
jgi:hypothetical protein